MKELTNTRQIKTFDEPKSIPVSFEFFEIKYIRSDIVQELISMLENVKPLISKTLGLQSLSWEELSVINKIQQEITAAKKLMRE